MGGRAGLLRIALGGALLATLTLPGSAPADPGEPEWRWGASVLLYVVPGEPSYLQPTVTADRGWLHLEARYDYEARETGSVWAGYNLAVGEEVRFGITAMVGGVFGKVNGIAPGVTLTLDWGPLALWHQSEYVFDLVDSAQSFYYVWTELSVTGPDWLRVGVALQRTRAFQTDTEVQAGPLVGFSFWKLSATVYLFAPAQEDQFVVVALAGGF